MDPPMRTDCRERTRCRPRVDALDERCLPSHVPAPFPPPLGFPGPPPPSLSWVATAAPLARGLIIVSAARPPLDDHPGPRPVPWPTVADNDLVAFADRAEPMADRPPALPAPAGAGATMFRAWGQLPPPPPFVRDAIAEGEAREVLRFSVVDAPWSEDRAVWVVRLARGRLPAPSPLPDLAPEESRRVSPDVAAPATADPGSPSDDRPAPPAASRRPTVEWASGVAGVGDSGIPTVQQPDRASSTPPSLRSPESPAAVANRPVLTVSLGYRVGPGAETPREAIPSTGADVLTEVLPDEPGALETSLSRFLERVDELTGPMHGQDDRPPGPFPLLAGAVALEAARRWHRRRSAPEALRDGRPLGLVLHGFF